MSIGYGKSYQYAGINRVGKYRESAREKGPADRNVCRSIERPNEVWRRVTGIFPGVNISPEDRRAGLERLMEWIEARVKVDCGLRNSDCGLEGEAGSGAAHPEDLRLTPHPGLALLARPYPSRGEGGVANDFSGEAEMQGEVALVDEPPVAHLSLAEEWDFAPKDWARVRAEGKSVEALCAQLGLMRSALTVLLKEHCGLSAGEFIYGLKFKSLKEALACRLRDAAEGLWGYPGSYVARKLEGPKSGPLTLCRNEVKKPSQELGRKFNAKYYQAIP
jgi:hypothetical protein